MAVDPARDKRIVKARIAGKSFQEIADAEGMSKNGAFLASKRLQPELLKALKRADAGLDRVVHRIADHMNQNYDRNVSLSAAKELLKAHGVNTGADTTAGKGTGATNIMVIVGATDDRMKALKQGNVIEVKPDAE